MPRPRPPVPLALATCRRCGVPLPANEPAAVLGRWTCRRHLGVAGDGRYACCGADVSPSTLAAAYYWPHGGGGCTPCDHVLASAASEEATEETVQRADRVTGLGPVGPGVAWLAVDDARAPTQLQAWTDALGEPGFYRVLATRPRDVMPGLADATYRALCRTLLSFVAARVHYLLQVAPPLTVLEADTGRHFWARLAAADAEGTDAAPMVAEIPGVAAWADVMVGDGDGDAARWLTTRLDRARLVGALAVHCGPPIIAFARVRHSAASPHPAIVAIVQHGHAAADRMALRHLLHR